MSSDVKKSEHRNDQWRIAALVAGALLAWFAVDNAHSVNIHFWVTTVRSPVIVVIVASALLGALIVYLWNRARPRH